MLVDALVILGTISLATIVTYKITKAFFNLILHNEKEQLNYDHEKNMEDLKYGLDIEKNQALADMAKDQKKKTASTLKRSKAVLTGQAAEQIAPYLEDFPYYPGDTRFLGSPIDMVVFDGAIIDDIEKVVLVEIKTGNSRLNERQKQIKKAVQEGKVEWLEYRIDTDKIKLEHGRDLDDDGNCLCEKCLK